MARFVRFKEGGLAKIATSLGYTGDMSGFQDYLNKNPILKDRMKQLEDSAIEMASKTKYSDYQQRQEQPAPQQQYQQPIEQYQQPVEQAPPSEKALEWKENNPWFGTQNVEATVWAQHVHNTLAGEGYDLESDEYYNELSNRIYKVYPDLKSDNAVQSEDRPAVQRVASASVGSRQKTQGKENGVRFSKSEVETLQGLKPHGMSDEAWLKSVAKEKQRIANREAK